MRENGASVAMPASARGMGAGIPNSPLFFCFVFNNAKFVCFKRRNSTVAKSSLKQEDFCAKSTKTTLPYLPDPTISSRPFFFFLGPEHAIASITG